LFHWGRNIQTSSRAHKCLVSALLLATDVYFRAPLNLVLRLNKLILSYIRIFILRNEFAWNCKTAIIPVLVFLHLQYPFLHPIVVLLYTKGTKIPLHNIFILLTM
jgi:hypothetical protein